MGCADRGALNVSRGSDAGVARAGAEGGGGGGGRGRDGEGVDEGRRGDWLPSQFARAEDAGMWARSRGGTLSRGGREIPTRVRLSRDQCAAGTRRRGCADAGAGGVDGGAVGVLDRELAVIEREEQGRVCVRRRPSARTRAFCRRHAGLGAINPG